MAKTPKKSGSPAARGRARATSGNGPTRFCVRVSEHGSTTKKIMSHWMRASGPHVVLGAIKAAMDAGLSFGLHNQEEQLDVLLGLPRNCAVEVLYWEDFVAEQAGAAADQVRKQLS